MKNQTYFFFIDFFCASGTAAADVSSSAGAEASDSFDSGQYTDEALRACRRALITLIKRVGKWGTDLVVVGGLAHLAMALHGRWRSGSSRILMS